MGKELKFSFDKERDVLDISIGEPVDAISQEIEDDFFIRIEPQSKEVVGFSILNFERWFKDKNDIRTIPISAKFEFTSRELI